MSSKLVFASYKTKHDQNLLICKGIFMESIIVRIYNFPLLTPLPQTGKNIVPSKQTMLLVFLPS